MFPVGMYAGLSAGEDSLNQNFVTTSNIGTIQVQIESNHFTTSAYVPPAAEYMTWGSFQFEQFGAGIFNVVDDQVFVRVNLDNTRYRARWIGGDQPDSGLVFNLGDGVFSVWRGGNPGAPLQQDNIANFSLPFNNFGTKSTTIQLQIEEPDGSLNIVSDRTMSLSITRNP